MLDDQSGNTGEERRRATRRRTVFAAVATDVTGAEIAPVRIRNLSDTGAGLRCEGPPLPTEFILNIPEKQMRTRCRIAWQQGADYGVAFLASVAPVEPPKAPVAVAEPRATLDSRVAELEREVQSLKMAIGLIRRKMAERGMGD